MTAGHILSGYPNFASSYSLNTLSVRRETRLCGQGASFPRTRGVIKPERQSVRVFVCKSKGIRLIIRSMQGIPRKCLRVFSE